MNEPWSKRHKREFKGCGHNLSNSFAEPLTMPELIRKVKDAGDSERLVDQYHNHRLDYVPNGGSLDLREDIARVVYGGEISARNILVFPGGQVAIQAASQAFARGCHSVVFEPGYQSTVESPLWAAGSGGATRVPRRARNGWQVDPRELRAAIRPDTGYLILNEPYNPGGVVMGEELQREVIDICREHGIVILCDEVYRLLEHSDELRLPAMANAYEKGISVVTMSKPWGGCGITIGWLACSDADMVERLTDVQYFGTVSVSRASEIQARMVLKVSKEILEERLAIILRNRSLLEDFIEAKYPEWFEWVRPNAGAIAFVRFRGPLSSSELGRRLAAEGISMKPAYCFTDTVIEEVDCFRVGYGEEQMPLALEALGRFVETQEETWRAETRK